MAALEDLSAEEGDNLLQVGEGGDLLERKNLGDLGGREEIIRKN